LNTQPKYDFAFEEVSVYACALKLIKQYARPGGLHIDLGCGHGAIAGEVQKAGLRYVGFDSDAVAVERLASRGFEAYAVDLADPVAAVAQIRALCSERAVASISMLDVIEHLPLSSTFLSALHDWVIEVPGQTRLVISVPNFAHFDVAAKLLAGRWDYTVSGLLDQTHHVVYTAALLDRAMGSHGWKEIDRNDYRMEFSDQYKVEPVALQNRDGGIGRHLRSIKQMIDPLADVHQFVRVYEPLAVSSDPVLFDSSERRCLLSFVVTCASGSALLETCLAGLARQSDMDFQVLLICSDADSSFVNRLLDQFPGIKQHLSGLYCASAVLETRFWTSIESVYWTVLPDSLALHPDYVAQVRQAAVRANYASAIALRPGKSGVQTESQTDGSFCRSRDDFAAVAAAAGPWLLIPVAYGRQFREAPPGLRSDRAWRKYFLAMSLRIGLWHQTQSAIALDTVTQPPAVLGQASDFSELLGEAAGSIWPGARELLDLMAPDFASEISSAKAARSRAEAALASVEAEALRMRQTLSWRITTPLRFLDHLMRGRWGVALAMLQKLMRAVFHRLPSALQMPARDAYRKIRTLPQMTMYSPANAHAVADMIAIRFAAAQNLTTLGASRDSQQLSLPAIDISAVTYNSEKWIEGFVSSLQALRYPPHLLCVWFVDNSSTDNTVAKLNAAAVKLKAAGLNVDVLVRPNLGFGAGHNAGIKSGNAPFCLVTNVDLEFEPDSLASIAMTALNDEPVVASWEFRQKPYEHPKLYDPVTGHTTWNSHACVLLRRSAFESLGGYDEMLFMYGEDVELSYRLRRAGYRLRYCPNAVVHHYTYEQPGQIKPLQFTGSLFANLYIRLKFGRAYDIANILPLALLPLLSREPYDGARKQLLKEFGRLGRLMPRLLRSRKATAQAFPFRGFDYELARPGAFVPVRGNRASTGPLVTVITRTYRGRGAYLRQCMASVLGQTYPHIEHVVVEDGGASHQALVESIADQTGRSVRFKGLPKVGRSAAGNAGLSMAQGTYCLFLDDDDLLFAEHLEVLVHAIQDNPDVLAAYTPALEVLTDTASFDVDGSPYVELRHGTPSFLHHDFSYERLKTHNCMAIQSVLFSRSLFLERGGFEEDMDVLEDWNLWHRYACGNRFVFVPKVTSMFRTPVDAAKRQQRQKAFDAAYPIAVQRAKEIDSRYSGRAG
jgi:GT2 family glycosyltransferase